MEIETLIDRATSAFARAQPLRINDCPCEECHELSQLLSNRSPFDLPQRGMWTELALLSSDSLLYFIPGLMRLCLSDDPEDPNTNDVGSYFLSILDQPISKRNPPEWHPKLGPLTAEQTYLILEFLRCYQQKWIDPAEGTPRTHRRALANWTKFLELAAYRELH